MRAASCLASCFACAGNARTTVVSGISRQSVRPGFAYCCLFALSLIVPAWILREVPAALMEKLSWMDHFHKLPDREWFETDAVLWRVSLGNCLFFTIMAIMMVSVKNQKDLRDRLHHGGWMVKVACWCLLLVSMFFLPNEIVSFYESISKVGSELFLLVQAMILLDFVNELNEKCVGYVRKQYWHAFLYLSFVNLGIMLFSFFLLDWFIPPGSCGLNALIIIFATQILPWGISVIPLDSEENVAVFPTSIVSLYCTYLCYNGLASEPREYECIGFHRESKAVSTTTLTIGLLTTVLSVVYSAYNCAGADEPLLPLDNKPREQEVKDKAKPVKYSYSIFYIIFSLASMNSAMLLTGWPTLVGEGGKLVDVGWPFVWVRLLTGLATASFYIWTMAVPVFTDKELCVSYKTRPASNCLASCFACAGNACTAVVSGISRQSVRPGISYSCLFTVFNRFLDSP